jgi:hypothetical protein
VIENDAQERIDLLTHALADGEPIVQAQAIQCALHLNITDRAFVDVLSEIARSSAESRSRAMAMRGLAELMPDYPETRALLHEAAQDADITVKTTARALLQKLTKTAEPN